MVDVKKLKNKMYEMEVTQQDMAKALHMDLSSANRKINDETGKMIRISELLGIMKVLDLSVEETMSIFFVGK